MNTTMDAVQETDKPPMERIETMSADLFLQRRLGKGEPRAWALAWCEAGLVSRRSTMTELEMPC